MTDKTGNEQNISFVSWVSVDEHTYARDIDNISIVMRRDGAGPMGWYDVIYITNLAGEVNALPAHQCTEWVIDAILEEKDDG